jgi:hypothetical protein
MHTDAEINVDFWADFLAHMRTSLTNEGFTNVPDDDDELELRYFDVRNREISSGRRTISLAKSFVVPPTRQAGYDKLCREVVAGRPLRAYQSKTMDKHDYGEGLFNDWGIHHLHLGEKLEPSGTFIERTGDILFAIFKPRHAYFITIQMHGPGHTPWADRKLVEEAERNWPHLTVKVPMGAQGLPPARVHNPSAADITAARKAGVTAVTFDQSGQMRFHLAQA